MWCQRLLFLLLPLLTNPETFFEGDLLFQDTVLSQQSPELFVKGSGFKWPGGVVPYAFEALSRFSPAEREVVRLSMNDIQDRTGCVEFVETDISRGGDIVLITKLGFGTQSGKGKCWAQLGRQGGTQAINLGEPGCFNTRTVTHELLHTVGVIHEHTRFDRDEHVRIISENVAPGKMKNFDIRAWKETEHSDTTYDYKSVMHYNMYAFSKDLDDPNKITIQPHHEEFEGIGEYNDFMSGIDAVEVALAYGCALKPETLVEFVNDNVEILQTVQSKHTEQIKALQEGVPVSGAREELQQILTETGYSLTNGVFKLWYPSESRLDTAVELAAKGLIQRATLTLNRNNISMYNPVKFADLVSISEGSVQLSASSVSIPFDHYAEMAIRSRRAEWAPTTIRIGYSEICSACGKPLAEVVANTYRADIFSTTFINFGLFSATFEKLVGKQSVTNTQIEFAANSSSVHGREIQALAKKINWTTESGRGHGHGALTMKKTA